MIQAENPHRFAVAFDLVVNAVGEFSEQSAADIKPPARSQLRVLDDAINNSFGFPHKPERRFRRPCLQVFGGLKEVFPKLVVKDEPHPNSS